MGKKAEVQTQIAAKLAPMLYRCNISSHIMPPGGAYNLPLSEGCYALISGDVDDMLRIGSLLSHLAKTEE